MYIKWYLDYLNWSNIFLILNDLSPLTPVSKWSTDMNISCTVNIESSLAAIVFNVLCCLWYFLSLGPKKEAVPVGCVCFARNINLTWSKWLFHILFKYRPVPALILPPLKGVIVTPITNRKLSICAPQLVKIRYMKVLEHTGTNWSMQVWYIIILRRLF